MHTKAMKKTIILCVTMLISVSMFAQTAILSQIKDTADCRKWVESQLQQWSKVPLLITFDGEWGLAMRLAGTPDFPKNRILGCIEDDSLIYRYGREVARQLHEIGAQVNFAPVADIDNNPDNPVINIRSFGSNPKEDGGILAVCKHFPGHGDTETDSHVSTPVLNFDRTRLDSIELYPFREAVEAGIGGMMVGHLQVPEIEDKPASISPEVITSILRNEFGFSGLVFTDALEMKVGLYRCARNEGHTSCRTCMCTSLDSRKRHGAGSA